VDIYRQKVIRWHIQAEGNKVDTYRQKVIRWHIQAEGNKVAHTGGR